MLDKHHQRNNDSPCKERIREQCEVAWLEVAANNRDADEAVNNTTEQVADDIDVTVKVTTEESSEQTVGRLADAQKVSVRQLFLPTEVNDDCVHDRYYDVIDVTCLQGKLENEHFPAIYKIGDDYKKYVIFSCY